MNQFQNDLQNLVESVQFTRNLILDACEQEMSGSVRWPVLRIRMLKYFAGRGIEGQLQVFFDKHSTKICSQREHTNGI